MLGVSNATYYYSDMDNGAGAGGDDNSGYVQQTGEFQKVNSVLVDGGDRFGVSAVHFDMHEELIWMGNRGGHVTSYYGANLEKYTSFQVTMNQEVRQILTYDDIILILSETQLRGQIRRGIPIFTHMSENLLNMQCMLQTCIGSTVLLGGHQETLVEYDLSQNVETKVINIGGSGCAILRGQGLNRICAGMTSGQVFILDARTYNKEQSIDAHSGSLSDLDVQGNFLVTCGFSNRHGSCSVDRFLKIYDLRMLRALAPIQVSIDPIMLRFLPSFSSRIAALSPTGQMEILETQALTSANIVIYQVTSNGSESRAFDVSSSCHHLAFGDEAGTLNLFSSNPSAMFNPFSRPTEFADPVEQFPHMSYTDESVCFSSIPLPMMSVSEPLASDWPSYLTQPGYRRHQEIDPQLLQSMKMVGPIGYAPNPGTIRRNQVQYKYESPKSSGGSGTNMTAKQPLSPSSALMGPSGRKAFSPPSTSPQSPVSGSRSNTRHPVHAHHHHHHQAHHARHPHSGQVQQGKFHIPKRYARIEWKKPTFEVTDIEQFNKTKFSGLEAVTVNSYCNPMIQVLYHIEYLRGFLISHLCKREACLSCELGFLFYMLDQSRTIPCAASNFLRSFRVVPEATALGLIRTENQAKQRSGLYRLISNWNRFILHQIETETTDNIITVHCSTSKENAVAELFAMKQENVNSCVRCDRVEKKESVVLLSNLLHDSSITDRLKCSFVSLLERTLYPEQTTPAWCEMCKKYSTTFQSRAPKNLPHVLSINTCLDGSNKDFEWWTAYMESLLSERSVRRSTGDFNTTPPGSATMVSAAPGHLKACRYGAGCARPDCKFWHENRSVPNTAVKTTEFDNNSEVQVKWLPAKIRITIGENGRLSVVDLDTVSDDSPPPPSPKSRDGESIPCISDYELVGVVIYVKDPDNEEKNNLVSVIKVGRSYFERSGQPPSSQGGWFLFNDFCVKEVSASEAMYFNPKWKVPSVVYYQKVPLPDHLQSYPVVPTVTVDVLNELFLPKPKPKEAQGTKPGKSNKQPIPVPYKPLDPEEIPQYGELVAMDAEFVTLGQEETELRSDGKLSTVKPQQLSLARVTCLRGQGPLEGTPFIDDYISTQEVVVDYLTKFSGIQPGDLDINFSSKHLITLKSVYLKLRFLIDSGVKFVGHGLNNDFRVMNLVVPPDQVIDTVNLFYLPNQRMVSLKFLAWHFLGESIQSETHDSAEDARSALALYRKYEELVKSGTLEKALEELYETGSRLQWKVNEEK